MKKLVLLNARWDVERFFIENVNISDVIVKSMYKFYKRDLKYKVAVFWMLKCKLPFQSLWYENWRWELNNYDIVVVKAENLSWQILYYIKKKNPHIRIIVWYWDTVDEKHKLVPKKYQMLCELWSYDEKDCERYGMKENVQFYYPIPIENYEILYDAMFVGRDKGRIEQLNQICQMLKRSGFKVYTYIQRDKKVKGHSGKKLLKPMEYKEVLKLVAKSRCIIDIPKPGQTGMTLRVLESLFYNKKLITVDKNISKAEFYNPANIFVWDNPSEKELQDFFSMPCEPIQDKIKKKYTFEAWIRNFE